MAVDFSISFIAGVFATGFVWVAVDFILPRLRDFFRPAPNLKGNWDCFDVVGGSEKKLGHLSSSNLDR
ncbi:hypothetical protein [Pseudoalteromonas umbrosa]|uniref:hypothetical protein n=1 Tax=Pseudoalteromonas umbrosa TaxID=3048489 RepID=UPI0024C343DB|nr:hypothetical protein [Pseudoalteromonas sp. B95]MDK1285754.1 hypothetical protein [Pseudoalteromonas sp. B95]